MAVPGGRFSTRTYHQARRAAGWTRQRVRASALSPDRSPVLLLTTVGPVSEVPRKVPLIYVRDGRRLVVAASNGSSGSDPAWWLNLRARRRGRVDVDRQTYDVTASEVPEGERDRLWRSLVETYPGFQTYEKRKYRRIPVVALEPADRM